MQVVQYVPIYAEVVGREVKVIGPNRSFALSDNELGKLDRDRLVFHCGCPSFAGAQKSKGR